MLLSLGDKGSAFVTWALSPVYLALVELNPHFLFILTFSKSAFYSKTVEHLFTFTHSFFGKPWENVVSLHQ
jgi:hypothetical protein